MDGGCSHYNIALTQHSSFLAWFIFCGSIVDHKARLLAVPTRFLLVYIPDYLWPGIWDFGWFLLTYLDGVFSSAFVLSLPSSNSPLILSSSILWLDVRGSLSSIGAYFFIHVDASLITTSMHLTIFWSILLLHLYHFLIEYPRRIPSSSLASNFWSLSLLFFM